MGTENTSGKLGFKKKFGYAIGQMVDSGYIFREENHLYIFSEK